jgi:ABC-type Fe3+ transport system permease subunit
MRDNHLVQRLVQRWSILGAVLLCTLISGLLADSLFSAWQIEPGQPTARGWRWFLGDSVQTFATETLALLAGVVLLGFALAGVWFLAGIGIRWLRRRLF